MRSKLPLSSHLVLVCLLFGTFAVAADRPNVVLFLVDDMGWMDSGVYGSRYYETPHMDRFATQAMRFTDAYAVPLCSPTRASILTGQYSARHGITSATGHRPAAQAGASPYPEKAPPTRKLLYADSKNYLDLAFTTLPETLRDAGYRTGHFGKWHLGLMPEHWPGKHGFETIWHCAPDPGPPNYFSPYGVHRDGKPSAQHKVGNITDGPPGEHIADRLTDEAIKFIEAHRNEPFYLNLWHYSVHGPWQHKEAYTAEFAKKTDPRGKQGNPVMASMLRCVDDSLGRIQAKLRELGLAEDTLFVFFSDNGGNTHSWGTDDPKLRNVTPKHRLYDTIMSYRKWAGGEVPTNNAPLREGKGRIYEGGQRVPLMVRWPGRIKPGSTSDAVVGAIDLYPTILDALGIARPQGHTIDGVSFLSTLEGKGTVDREAYFTWFPHLVPAVSVRAGDWKLIRRWESHPAYPALRELYNLKKNIGETDNLAGKMPAKVAEMDALIDRFIVDTGALVPKPNPDYREPSPADGLVPKMSKMTAVEGALRVEAAGKTPFLGTAQVRLPGPLTLSLRVRCRGGRAKVQWMTADQKEFPRQGQVVEFTLADKAGWQDIEVQLPINGIPRIVRLYLPADKAPVDVQTIRYVSRQGKAKAWDFSAVSP